MIPLQEFPQAVDCVPALHAAQACELQVVVSRDQSQTPDVGTPPVPALAPPLPVTAPPLPTFPALPPAAALPAAPATRPFPGPPLEPPVPWFRIAESSRAP